MKKKLIIFGVVLVLLITPFFLNYNQLSKQSDDGAFISSLEAEIPALLDKYKIPGAAISIIEDGKVKWVGTFGYSNIDEQIKIERDTVFQVASISKAVTSLGIMKLVEDGRVELDAPIDKYVTRWSIPESTYDKSQVTVRRLLSHTSGLSVGGGYPGYDPNTELPTIEESLSGIEGAAKPVIISHEPGTKFSYSGGGYSLLQILIEEVTGMNYDDYMKTQVLEVMDMNNSSFQWEGHLQDQTAKAYDQELNQIPNYLFIEKAAAGLYTTIDDINKFMITEIKSYSGNHAENLLSKETMESIYTPILEVSGLEGFIYQKIALGHFVNIEKNGAMLISHDGGNKGWKANFTMIPNRETGVAILTNGDHGTYLLNEVLNSWYFNVFGTDRSFDELQHRVSAIVFSLTSILILWSGIALYSLIKEVNSGRRKLISLSNEFPFIVKFFIIAIMLYGSYLFKNTIVSILSFIDPNIGNIIFSALFIRVIVGIIQIIVPRLKEIGSKNHL